MNRREIKCVEILTDLIVNYGAIGVKTSFEDEGALFSETIRLKEICNQAGTKLTLKIGGPEAIRDIKDSYIIGVKGLVAPMIESPFAVKKFVNAVYNTLPHEMLEYLELGINIETTNAYGFIKEILDTQEVGKLGSVTFGRVDFVSSDCDHTDREYVDNSRMFHIAQSIFHHAREKGLKTCVGGAISVNSENFITTLKCGGLLDKFETRYIIFDAEQALKNYPTVLSKAQQFELEWMFVKADYYGKMALQDASRMEMIQKRLNDSSNAIQ